MPRSKPYQSKLNPFEREILTMWFNASTLVEIQSFLKTKQVNISIQGISGFIRRRVKRRNPHIAPAHIQEIINTPQVSSACQQAKAVPHQEQNTQQNEPSCSVGEKPSNWSELTQRERSLWMLKKMEEEQKARVTYLN